MIVSDYSNHPRFKKLAKAYEDALVRLAPIEKAYRDALPPFPDLDIETHWDHPVYLAEARLNRIFRYLRNRSWRPLYQALKAHYEVLWPKAGMTRSYGYFFPEHTAQAISFRAADRIKKLEQH